MKKIILIAAMVLGFAIAASAQPRALGIRGGYGVDLSYQHTVGGSNFIEADLGLESFANLNVAATYNFMISEFGGGFGFYAGPGVALGAGKNVFGIGIAGQIGIEYTFHFPLQLSLDMRPQLGYVKSGDVSGLGIWGWAPHLGIRYRF